MCCKITNIKPRLFTAVHKTSTEKMPKMPKFLIRLIITLHAVKDYSIGLRHCLQYIKINKNPKKCKKMPKNFLPEKY